MMKQHKHAVGLFLVVALVPLLMVLSGLYYYDPFQIFHRSYIDDSRLQKNMRQQAAGIINNFDFDSVVLGTSMLENTSAAEASQLLGGRFVNISISGSDFYERKLVLQYALEKKALKTVIFSLDAAYYLAQRKGNPKYPLAVFDYLYDHNRFNDFNLYLNEKYLGCFFKGSTSRACLGPAADFDRPNAWLGKRKHQARFGGMENWQTRSKKVEQRLIRLANKAKRVGQRKKPKPNPEMADDAIRYIEDNLISIVKAHPQTDFIFLFPPYYRGNFAFMAQFNGTYGQHASVVKHLSEVADQQPNLQVFGFENESFVDDIANYKDMSHYSEKYNSVMLQKVSQGQGRLDRSNVDEYVKQSRHKALSFDLVQFGQALNAVISAKNI